LRRLQQNQFQGRIGLFYLILFFIPHRFVVVFVPEQSPSSVKEADLRSLRNNEDVITPCSIVHAKLSHEALLEIEGETICPRSSPGDRGRNHLGKTRDTRPILSVICVSSRLPWQPRIKRGGINHFIPNSPLEFFRVEILLSSYC
jgi:hypothetical protein